MTMCDGRVLYKDGEYLTIDIERTYYETEKNKKNTTERLEMNKFCKFCKKHTTHKETK